MKRVRLMTAIALCIGLPISVELQATESLMTENPVERGRYLVAIGSCNDCHSPGFEEIGDQFPEADRLLGSDIGFAGPWGVSYPANLRLSVAGMAQDQWLARIRRGGLPPMPWPALKALTDTDAVAIYQYLKSLGPLGNVAPAPVAPGLPIPTEYILFAPLPPTTLEPGARPLGVGYEP